MPELPDIELYLHALRPRVRGRVLECVRIASPFLLRSVDPPITDAEGKRVESLRRLGKRIVFALEGELFLVLHLMIAGRLDWKEHGPQPAKAPGKVGLAAFDFDEGTLLLIEAGTQRRASLHLVRGEAGLASLHAPGLEALDADGAAFAAALRRENHTLKRALTDPRLFSGIGNAFSDEILHAARLSPVTLVRKLGDDEVDRLFHATIDVLTRWTDKLRADLGDRFPRPREVTAFRDGYAVHGKFGRPCPACGTGVQRIVFADNETNYCPRCQTGGKVLADRSLSRLLKGDWPRTIEDGRLV